MRAGNKGMSRGGLAVWLTLLLLAALLTGCSNQKTAGEPETLPAGTYLVYYMNTAGTTLVSQEYKALQNASDAEALAGELMEQFFHVPKELDCQTAISDKVVFQGCRREDRVLYLYFDMNYTAMRAEQEILCRAALTRMLTQIDGIDYISIYCGDQPLMDRQGNLVGILTASDFISNTSNVNSFEKTELTLYFADASGSKLRAERREVVHNINTSLEQLVVEQLIAGPKEEGNYATLPSDCKILSLSVTDSVCYINFDSAFLSTALPVNEYVPIYSIVDSLSEMTNITKVQIMVNGSQNVMFRDAVSLNTAFERSQDYILQE